jgi:alcohol dehydrogenase (NADP+)
MHDIENAYTRMLKSDVKHRFVIDMATLKATDIPRAWLLKVK